MATFQLDPAKLGSGGTNVRCGKCGFVFFAPPPAAEKEDDSIANAEMIPLTPITDFAGTVSETHKSEEKFEIPKPQRRTPFPRREKSLAHTPLIGNPLSFQQRLGRIAVTMLVAVGGLLIGLASIGVSPAPEPLSLLFGSGIRNISAGLNILQYEGVFQPSTPKKRILEVNGELYNGSDRSFPPPNLMLEVFSSNGAFLNRTIAPCCKSPVTPHTKIPFTIQTELNAADSVGTYKVSLDTASGASKL